MFTRQRSTVCIKRSRRKSGTSTRVTIITGPGHVRAAFERGRYEERLARGELRETVRKVKERTSGEGDSRASQEVAQWARHDGTVVAVVHRSKDAFGQPAASGRPDPKWLGGGHVAPRAGDSNSKTLPQHDYRRLTADEFAPIEAGWTERHCYPVWGMRCANCGRLWIELASAEGGFHAEARSLVRAPCAVDATCRPAAPITSVDDGCSDAPSALSARHTINRWCAQLGFYDCPLTKSSRYLDPRAIHVNPTCCASAGSRLVGGGFSYSG
jgi:hypothetical protein